MMRRVPAFVTVGAIGFLLQLATIALLTMGAGWPYGAATVTGVSLAVVHNFLWHRRWTWRDRVHGRWETLRRFPAYVVTTGLTSVGGNLLATVAGVELLGLHATVASAAGVAIMAAANFTVADRCVFAPRRALLALAMVAVWVHPAGAEGPSQETLDAWNRYVASADAQVHQCGPPRVVLDGPRPAALPQAPCHETRPAGQAVPVPGGTIHHWRGSILVHGTTVERVVQALMDRGVPPPQEDVLESRVLARTDQWLRVYLKLSRTAIVTVVYDTEHDVTFQRQSPALATSRSVSTRIAEVGERDRGFLWRLQSYWRYTQVGDAVRIDLESVSLSRDVPRLVRPVAGPIVDRIARESLARTLDSVRRFLESGGVPLTTKTGT